MVNTNKKATKLLRIQFKNERIEFSSFIVTEWEEEIPLAKLSSFLNERLIFRRTIKKIRN